MQATRNSALFWLPPLLEAHPDRVPKTEIFEFSSTDLFPMLDGEEPLPGFSLKRFRRAAIRVGCPLFVRTDLASAKHAGPSAYRLNSLDPKALWAVIYQTFEDNCLKMMEDHPRAFLLREWLDLDASFTAFGGHPIAREWRFFVEQEGVSAFFYWPKEALQGHTEDDLSTYGHLARPLCPTEKDQLTRWAQEAAHAVGGGEWSVDFAQDRKGRWWLIDMALAEASWRPERTP